MRSIRELAAIALLACLAFGEASAQTAPDLEPVTLQLKWKHQFQFAGYYAAIERGYYRDAGFEVRVAEFSGEDTIAAVLRGAADFGIANSEVALRRALGEPVVALATILQHSALALAVRGGADLSVHDLAGKTIMVTPHDVELFAYLRREGLPTDAVKRVPQSFDLDDLFGGKVDGFSIYTTDQVDALRARNFVHTVLSPRAAGIDFYGDTLFTSQQRAQTEPQRVAAFRGASLRGWQYAMEHPDEIADLIIARYSKLNSRQHLLFEAAEMRRLMQPELVEIGHMNPGRWRHIADVYADLGMLPRDYSLDGFLFDPEPRREASRLYGWLALAVVSGLLVAALAAWQARRNRDLRAAIRLRDEADLRLRDSNDQLRAHLQEIRALQIALEEQAIRDALTGLYNRRYLDETMERELKRAERQKVPISLLVLDIDHFKRLNDTYGHPGGDLVLKSLGSLLREQVRAGDLACRWGGEEFVLLLPAAAPAAAAERAERLRQAFKERRVAIGVTEVVATLSIGVASYPEHASTTKELLRAADDALYRAKRDGRDCVRVAVTH